MKKEMYIDEKGNKYWGVCSTCGKYKYYLGWTIDSKLCRCPEITLGEIRQKYDFIISRLTEWAGSVTTIYPEDINSLLEDAKNIEIED